MGYLRVQVLQHMPFEGLGAIEAWLQQRDARVDICRLFASEPLPALSDGDLLIGPGGGR